MKRIKTFYRKAMHSLIVKYLYKCGGAFHHGEYGVNGRYVKVFTDEQYGQHQNDLVRRKGDW